MMMRVRVSLTLAMVLAMIALAGCDHYVCNATFGASSCTGGPLTLSQSGGGTANAAFVFAVDEGQSGATNGTIDGFTLDTSANTFQAITSYTAPTIPSNNGGVGMVVAQKQFLYAGFGNVGQLYGWSIDSSGNLTAIAGSPFLAPALDDFIGGVGQANMITNPAGTFLYFSAGSVNGIYVYSIGSGGVLTQVAGSPFSVPFPPMNLATDGLGKYLYAIDGDYFTHTGSEIQAYSIGTSGALTAVGSPLLTNMWQLQGEPTGKFMIGTSGNSAAPGFNTSGVDDLHLYTFSIGTTGALTEVGSFTTQYSPFSIAVSPNSGGNLVYSFSFNDTGTAFNSAEGYSISSTGTLTALSGSPFSGLTDGSWGQFDQSGQFLIDYASYFDPTTSTTVTTLSPFDVGSGGALTQPISTLTLTTPGFWVVTDPQ